MHAKPDTFHQVIPSSLGWLGVDLTDDGKVARLEVLPGPREGQPPRNKRDAHVLEFLKSQVDGYFRRSLRTFNLPINLPGEALEQRVWAETLLLRFGQCVNLAVLAQRVEAEGEAVAAALRANPIVLLVPSHRVLGWESGEVPAWLRTLREVEDIVPGDSTTLTYGSLPTTPQEVARATAQAPSATLHPRAKKGK
jgi:O6-methylguanine-DNA--protein-cysteine methyltransferase